MAVRAAAPDPPVDLDCEEFGHEGDIPLPLPPDRAREAVLALESLEADRTKLKAKKALRARVLDLGAAPLQAKPAAVHCVVSSARRLNSPSMFSVHARIAGFTAEGAWRSRAA